MKQDIKNKEPQERQTYVPASVKVIEVSARRVLCQSPTGWGNEQYGEGSTDGWYNN